jgi:hypothetical protein
MRKWFWLYLLAGMVQLAYSLISVFYLLNLLTGWDTYGISSGKYLLIMLATLPAEPGKRGIKKRIEAAASPEPGQEKAKPPWWLQAIDRSLAPYPC